MSGTQILFATTLVAFGFIAYLAWRARQVSQKGELRPAQDTNAEPEKNVTIIIHRGVGENSYSFELLEEEKYVKFGVTFPSSPLFTTLCREYLLGATINGLPGQENVPAEELSGLQIRMRKAIYEAVMDFENNVEPGSESGTLHCPISPAHMFYSLLAA